MGSKGKAEGERRPNWLTKGEIDSIARFVRFAQRRKGTRKKLGVEEMTRKDAERRARLQASIRDGLVSPFLKERSELDRLLNKAGYADDEINQEIGTLIRDGVVLSSTDGRLLGLRPKYL